MASTPARHPRSLVLGTVQFGLAYGVSNAEGQVTADEAQAIVDHAAAAGVRRLDTAAAYGASEQVVKTVIEKHAGVSIITKSPRVLNHDVDAALATARASLELFGPERMDAILLHSAWDLAEPAGERLWAGLGAFKADGLVRRIGFSAYPGDGPLALSQRFGPDLVQVPASVFDQRLIRSGEIEAMADAGVEVHVRSLFLQGLAFMAPDALPDPLKGAAPVLERWRRALQDAGVDAARGALDFGLSIRGAAGLVAGVTTRREFDQLAVQIAAPPTGLDFSAFAIEDEAILDPWRWGL